MPEPFEGPRNAFRQVRSALENDASLRGEFVTALTVLITEYNPSVRENRFAVGGAVEHILGSAMRAAGVSALNRGQTSVGFDIMLNDAVGLSVKASFQARPTDIRLINVLGKTAGAEWLHPTVLVIGGVGVGYIDPELLPDATVFKGDALLLPRNAWLPFLEAHDEWIARVDVPVNPKNQATKVASYAIAEEILGRSNFDLLRRHRTSFAP